MAWRVLTNANRLFSAIEVISKEVKVGTETIISCKVTGLTQSVNIVWSGLPDDETGYTKSAGTLNSETQTATLTVASAQVTEDKTYTCTVSSIQNTASQPESKDVDLKVYGMVYFVFVFLNQHDWSILT